MSEESSEQQELTDIEDAAEPDTWQEKIIDRYNSENLYDTAIGMWLKLFVEIIIVAFPLIILLLVPGVTLRYFEIVTASYVVIGSLYLTAIASVIHIVWCFTKITDEGEDSTEATGNQEGT